MNDPLFGGTGPTGLGSLESMGVYATLIPSNTSFFSLSGVFGGERLSNQASSLGLGEALYLVDRAAAPEKPDAQTSSAGTLSSCVVTTTSSGIAQSFEVRARDQDASNTGALGEQAIDLNRRCRPWALAEVIWPL